MTSLITLCFLTFSIVFWKTALFIDLKKPFTKSFLALFLRFLFMLIYGFSQLFWLNLMTIWTFFMWKFLMCITYSVVSSKLVTSFSTFLIFLLSGKMVNHYEVHVIFQDIEHHFKKPSFITFSVIVFYEFFIKLRNIFDPLKIIYWKYLLYCPSI